MAVAPEHYRAARLAIPRLPLSASLVFVFLGIGGSIFLTYTTFSHGEEKHFVVASSDSHVYAARAVPFESPREDPAQRSASIARALAIAQSEVRRSANARFESRSENSRPTLIAESDRELPGFSRLASVDGTNSYLAITGVGFGFGAQTAPGGFMAPDAAFESSVVPEASTWLYGSALFVLVAARGAHARWYRKRRR